MKSSMKYVLSFLLLSTLLKSQNCLPCDADLNPADTLTFRVSATDTSAYTLSTGQTLCIDNTGTFKGSVVNNGGTICNRGRFLPRTFTFNGGTLINHRTAKLKGDIDINATVTVFIYPESILTLNNDLILSGGTLNNEGLINIAGNIQNNSGSFNNRGIINCTQLSGSNTVVNYNVGLINTKN